MRKKIKIPKYASVIAYIVLGVAIGGIGAADPELSERMQEVESEYSDLQMEYDLLLEENQSLENELKVYQDQEEKVIQLEEQLEEIQVEYNNLEMENENLEEEIQEIQNVSVLTRGGDTHPVDEPEDAYEEVYEVTVWLSATGEKYHSIPNCGRMNPNKAREISQSTAESRGYERCSKCF